MKPISTTLSTVVVRGLLPLIDKRIPLSCTPYTGEPAMKPYSSSKKWTWTHYGVFIPTLPEPYRYLNTMTLIGATGTEIFDNDMLAVSDARNTATVLSSTAYDDEHFYKVYDTAKECHFMHDGSSLKWGDNLHIDLSFPTAHVVGNYDNFSVDVQLNITDQISYFVSSPIYRHFSLLAEYSGSINDQLGTTDVSGLCTFEYARCMTHQSLSSKPIPPILKLPVDFFTYQIIQVDEKTQILFTDVRARGKTACNLAQIRVLGQETGVLDNVEFCVLEYSNPTVDPYGRTMRVPHRLSWCVTDSDKEVLAIEGTIDSPLRFGHGRGYVGAYTYTGHYYNQEITGNGYLEWVDVEPDGL